MPPNNLHAYLPRAPSSTKNSKSPAKQNAQTESPYFSNSQKQTRKRNVITESDSESSSPPPASAPAPHTAVAAASKPTPTTTTTKTPDRASKKPKLEAPPQKQEVIEIEDEFDEFGDIDMDVTMLDANTYSSLPTQTVKSPRKTPIKSQAKGASKPNTPVKIPSSGMTPKANSFHNYRANAPGSIQQPTNPGSKPIPVGKPNCLEGLVLVFTGQLESTDRETATELAKRYGAKVTTTPSSRTSYVVLGVEAGPKKLEAIEKHKCKTLNEDQFLDMIAKTAPQPTSITPIQTSQPQSRSVTPISSKPDVNHEDDKLSMEELIEKIKLEIKEDARRPKASHVVRNGKINDELWTDKWAPRDIKDLVGNKASIERMSSWLKNWDRNVAAKFPGNGNHRAVLLSGPPGIGKTSAAGLVAKSLGYEVLEFNASDARSKQHIDLKIKELIGNHSIIEFMKGAGATLKTPIRKQVIVMDEVDGMSGGDRGGNAELIQLIKKTKVPIICICNDRQNTKVRSLVNYCHDLRFHRPKATELKGRITHITSVEGIQIANNVLEELAAGTQSDIRQILNLLSTYKLSQSTLDYDATKTLINSSQKNMLMGPFEIARTFLNASAFINCTLNAKIDAYFMDYSIVPLMVQENYLRMIPRAEGSNNNEIQANRMKAFSRAADSLSEADLVERKIFSNQDWSLMPTHAIFSCVRPAAAVLGGMSGGIEFPKSLGNISKGNKYWRILRELQIHMQFHASSDKNGIRQDYLPVLLPLLINPLRNEEQNTAVAKVIALLDSYYLTKEDYDALMEFGIGYLEQEIITKDITSQCKSALTRTYNKMEHKSPFALQSFAKARASGGAQRPDTEEAADLDDDVLIDSIDEEQEEEEEDLSKDKMVKAKKAPAKGKGKASTAATTKAKAATKAPRAIKAKSAKK